MEGGAHHAARTLSSRLHRLNTQVGSTVALFVPVRPDAKQPAVCHKGGAWTQETSERWLADHGGEKFRIGMLLYGLVAIDFDTRDLYPVWAAEFPELDAAPAEETRKGVHVYFRRCPAAQVAGLVDGPLRDPATRKEAKIDCKTVTGAVHDGHFTGSLIVCAPTPNYQWLPGRSLMELDPEPMSAALLQKVLEWRTVGAGKKRLRASEHGSAPPSVAPHASGMVEHFASDAELRELLNLMGFPLHGYKAVTRLLRFGDSIENLKVRLESDAACHFCGETHTDTMLVYVSYAARSGYELKARHQRDKNCHKSYIITATAEAANKRRVEATGRVPASEAVRVARLFINAGVRTDTNNPNIWRLPDPAPGFVAHAMLVGEDSWRLLLSSDMPDGAAASWWRNTKYPGLKHEFLRESLWTPASPPSARRATRPPFWPSSIMEETIGA